MTLSTHNWVRWIPALMWMGVIFFFSHTPGIDTGFSFDVLLKKTAHLIEYGILSLFLYLALTETLRTWSLPIARLSWVLSTLYAATDEFHQYFIPTRHARLLDVGIDSIGSYLALLILNWLLMHMSQKRKRPFGS